MNIRHTPAIIAIALAATILARPFPNGTAQRAMAAAAPPQIASAQLKIVPTAGTFNWPNDGVMPILTYGWSGDRPQPPAIAVDSSRLPLSEGDRPPILIIHRRDDIFSPLLLDFLDQKVVAHWMTLSVQRTARETKNYTMWNVRVKGIRNVGAVIEENPVTQEIVFAFDSVSIGSIEDPGR